MPIIIYSNLDEIEKRKMKERRELEKFYRDLAYDPNQPRAPKGSETGGEWTEKTKISFGKTVGTAVAQAMGDEVIVDKIQYSKMSEGGKLNLVAHELAHNLVEDTLLKDMNQWNKANDALLLQTIEKEKTVLFRYILGQSRIGEAMVSAIASYVMKRSPKVIHLRNGIGL